MFETMGCHSVHNLLGVKLKAPPPDPVTHTHTQPRLLPHIHQSGWSKYEAMFLVRGNVSSSHCVLGVPSEAETLLFQPIYLFFLAGFWA